MSNAMRPEYLITKRVNCPTCSELPWDIECVDCNGTGVVERQVDLRTALREITAEVQDDFARALEYAEQWRALTHTLRMENNLEITHFRQLVQYLEMKNERTEY